MSRLFLRSFLYTIFCECAVVFVRQPVHPTRIDGDKGIQVKGLCKSGITFESSNKEQIRHGISNLTKFDYRIPLDVSE